MRWNLVSPVVSEHATARTAVVGSRHPGRRIGFLSNRKPNALLIEQELARLAREAGFAVETHFYEKPGGPGLAAEPALLDRIAAECDAAVVGSAD